MTRKNPWETRGTRKRKRYKGGKEREETAMTRQSEPENDDEEQREGKKEKAGKRRVQETTLRKKRARTQRTRTTKRGCRRQRCTGRGGSQGRPVCVSMTKNSVCDSVSKTRHSVLCKTSNNSSVFLCSFQFRCHKGRWEAAKMCSRNSGISSLEGI